MEIATIKGRFKLSAHDIALFKRNNPYFKDKNQIDADFPGTINHGLFKAGMTKSPLGEDWTSQTGWDATIRFDWEKKGGVTLLSLSRVDGGEEITLNGHKVCEIKSFSSRVLVPVTDYLREKANNLTISFRTAGAMYEPIKLLTDSEGVISSWNCSTALKDGVWECELAITAEIFKAGRKKISAKLADTSIEEEVETTEGKGTYSIKFTLPDASLRRWEDANSGKPSLYYMDVALGGMSDRRLIGFRTVEVNEGKDSLDLTLNGKKTLIRSLTWKDMDSYSGPLSDGKYIRLLQSIPDARINTLWVLDENGKEYERETFYDSADRMGLMVIQRVGKDNAEYQVNRLKSHPSIIAWKADKEIAKTIKELDSSRAVLTSYSPEKNPFSPALPLLTAMEKIVGEEERNLTSPDVEALSTDKNGTRGIILGMADLFRMPSDFERACYLSQLVPSYQAERKIAECRIRSLSSDFGDFSETKPEIGGSAIEYGGKWKALMYSIKNCLAGIVPVGIVSGNTLRVFAVNDTDKDEEIKVSIKFSTFRGDKLKNLVHRVIVPSGSVAELPKTDISWADRDNAFCYLKASTPEIYRESLIWLDKPKRCRLEKPKLSISVAKTGKNFSIEVGCKRPAFYVMLDAGDLKGYFIDNLFNIRPTAQHIASFVSEEPISMEEFMRNLKVYDLYDSYN